MDKKKAERTKRILKNYTQIRDLVPFSDFKIYSEARKMGYPYREHMLRYGRRFMKKTVKRVGE